ncbi:hypothetical protein [Ornithinimicrobium sp. INDO-MA30-4]|uniref:hypothetical protein n=1 Tax=Ornithinimicrobium sp. INDO-MA30-4 TaxID=2908651 RepID=UPI001F1A5FB6|nr:hypothetical protein [Ornithinimicrobium sp. INDO-MA30-4]UJH71777.1 hypothetical protein L0A91_16975 [Ornithinimicrobium sp. INDO-MA30-4]
MTELSIAQQQGRLRDEIPQVVLPLPDSQVSLLPGVRSHVQGSSLIGLWDELLAALKGLDSTGQDAIVDLGRLGLAGAATPVLYGADLTLVVCRSDVVSLSGARSWLATLRAEFEEFGAGTSLGLLLVGPGQPYSAKEVSSVVGVPVVATIAWDPKTAPVFRDGERVRKFESSKLVRSLRAAQESMAAVVKANEDALNDMRGETR